MSVRRGYIIAALPKERFGEPREIIETAPDGARKVVATAPVSQVVDLLEVIRTAYENGREDRTVEVQEATRAILNELPQ